MDMIQAVENRHSVRSYQDKPIDAAVCDALRAEIDVCNAESGLRIALVTGEPAAFSGFMARYGKFSGVKNYIALIGKKTSDLEEKTGYYGERIAIKAQTLGLNTCWVGATYSKGACKQLIAPEERLVCVLAIGYGETQGVPHKSKPMDAVCRVQGEAPDWFLDGVRAALLAPTAMNQQKFLFSYTDGKVTATAQRGPYSKVDLGIVKYHFEVGSGKDRSVWA